MASETMRQISRRDVARGALIAAALPTGGCAAASDEGGRWLEVNGVRQWLLTRGPPGPAPTVLVLHGGPGASETVLFRHYNRALETRVRMAYWDQRGAGRSYDPKAPLSALTVAQHLADLGVVADRLRAEHGVPVVLLGHSWGSALGLLYAHRRPETVAGFIGVGQVASAPEQEAAGYAWALAEARRRGNGKATAALERIGPPPHDFAALMIKNRWVEAFGGYFHPGFDKMGAMLGALLNGETSIGEVRRLIAANDATLRTMWPEARALDLPARVPAVTVPIAFMLGRLDRQCPSALAARYFEQLQAPSKTLTWFERSAHNVPFEEPQAFNAALLKQLSDWRLLA